MSADLNILQIISGALVGLLVGLTGVGGGSLMTPVLILLLGVPPLTAVGTDLWFAAITKSVASRWFYQKGLIDWAVVRALWTGSLPTATIALLVIGLFGASIQLPSLTKQLVGIAVLLSGVGLLWQVRRQMLIRRLQRDPEHITFGELTKRQWAYTVTLGAAVGLLVTLSSIGAGALGMVVLTALYHRRLSTRHLIATDIVHAVPLTAFAGLGHWFLGDILYSLLWNLLIGSVPAVLLGSWLATRLPQLWLRLILCIVLWLVAAKLMA
jgi:hypothetical protein